MIGKDEVYITLADDSTKYVSFDTTTGALIVIARKTKFPFSDFKHSFIAKGIAAPPADSAWGPVATVYQIDGEGEAWELV
jgi:hypothetical protein